MAMNKLVVFLLCTLFLSGSLHAQSLEECVIASFHNDKQLQSEFHRLKYNKEEKIKKSLGMMPYANIQYIQPDILNSGKSIWKLQINQPIFDFGRSVTESQEANATFNAQLQDHRNVQLQFLLQSISTYMYLLQASEKLRINEIMVKTAEQHLEADKKRKAVGEATETDVAKSQAKLSSAQSNLVKAIGEKVSTQAKLDNLVGFNVTSSSFPECLPPVPSSLERALIAASETSPKILSSIHNQKRSQVGIVSALTRNAPKLEFNLSSMNRDLQEIHKSPEASLVLTMPLLDRGQNFHSSKQAFLYAKQSSLNMSHTKEELKISVINAWNEMETYRAFIKSTDDLVKSYEFVLNAVKHSSSMQMSSQLDLLDAENDLLEAQMRNIEARINYIKSVYNLIIVIGNVQPILQCITGLLVLDN